jgi:arabinogalactan endo-1,4-beta-galactosidase
LRESKVTENKHNMQKIWLSLLTMYIWMMAGSCTKDTNQPTNPEPQPPGFFIRGADLSLLPEIEAAGVELKDQNGNPGSMLDILKQAGLNTVRIRLWHSPQSPTSGLSQVAKMAAQVKAKGLKVWLCIHYSDTWADPGQQKMPTAWNGLSGQVLQDSIRNYTLRVVGLIQPDYVQAGNEVNDGMLWPAGRISTGGDFYNLLATAHKAIREAAPEARILVHYAGVSGSVQFFSQLQSRKIDYDIAGLSYYPYYHGKDLDYAASVLKAIGNSTGKAVVIAEVAYPFTLGWADNTHNLIGEEGQLVEGYPATPEGQKNFMMKIREMSSAFTLGAGFCYWGGEWVAYKGNQSTDGSGWENQALFDFDFKALPVQTVFAP